MEGTLLRIRGGKPLAGTIIVPGAKNAALKQIAAALLTEDTVVLENMPNITDVRRMLDIVRAFGVNVDVDWDNHRVAITASSIDIDALPVNEIRSLRASIVLLGPLLVRCGKVVMPYPGGDKIGARPLTAHIEALRQFGAVVSVHDNNLVAHIPETGLSASRVVLPEFSVTATENALMTAAGIVGASEVHIAAAEPHVQDLAKLLTKMGAPTSLIGPNIYRVEGNPNLVGTKHRVVGDVLDAFTFLAAGMVTRGAVCVEGINPNELELPIKKLLEMGVHLIREDNSITTVPTSGTLRATKIQVLPYPGIPSDLQPLFALLATQAEGTSLIQDPLYENRFRYLEELSRMGADVSMLDPHRAMVNGPSLLTGVPITTFDIRAGAVLVLAGLVAKGETTIKEIQHIDRGYEDIDGRLRSIGADIERASV